jgi:uncharacterized membrane protein
MSVEELEGSQILAPAERRAEVYDVLAALVAVLLIIVANAGVISWVRLLLTLAFAFFVPGRAIVSNWPRVSRWSPEGMSIVFSLGVVTFLATFTLWVHFWHPVPLFDFEAGLSLIGLIISIVRRRKEDAA